MKRFAFLGNFSALLCIAFFSSDVLADGLVTIKNAQRVLVTFKVEVAKTQYERGIGLSNRNILQKEHGLWLDFKEDTKPRMWMKDTKITLDLLFVKSSGEIVCIMLEARPYSLDIMQCKEVARYVLEVNSGDVSRFGIEVGNHAIFSEVTERY